MKAGRKRKRGPVARRQGELTGLGALIVGVFGLIWYFHPGGILGVAVAGLLQTALGSAAMLWLVALVAWGVLRVRGSLPRAAVQWTAGLLLLWLTLLMAAAGWTGPHTDGAGRLLRGALDQLLGVDGRDFLLVIWPLFALSLSLGPFVGRAMRGSERMLLRGARGVGVRVRDFVTEEVVEASARDESAGAADDAGEAVIELSPPVELPPDTPLPEPVVPQPPVEPLQSLPPAEPALQAVAPIAQAQPAPGGGHIDGYRKPPLTLLQPPEHKATKRDAQSRARRLEETLKSFGVQARVVEFLQGPAVTRFEVQPGPGVKVSRIVNLSDDIALAMAATDVRMEAPIPGKAAIGIEIPNSEIAPVRLREVLETPQFRDAASPLAVGLGKDIAGRPIIAALDRMPHLLIAGATGSGKSVSLNALIASLLFRAHPDEVKLLLIDPKVVELQQFNGIPHLAAPVVTDPKKAAGVLRGVVLEMEDRYGRFAKAGCRDIARYNQVGDEPLPYYVVVIDELADLMMVAPGEVEESICRLAQMARAAGIHLVVATQRPSVDVITGLIKANIPSRLAFAVSSQVDSRTILDHGGAERLLGKGDMLFFPLGVGKPVRAQGAYISEQEMADLIEFVKQGDPIYREDLMQRAEEVAVQDEGLDELFNDAVRVVVRAQQASASLLQRRMRVGYSRAARLVEQMEQKGIVGPSEGSKAREVRLTAVDYERLFGGPLD